MPRITFSPDRQRIMWSLASHKIPTLYHFTSINNLRRIFQMRAVCSREVLQAGNRLERVECGGDEHSHRQDDKLGNSAYISLSYKPRTPMAWHLETQHQICYLVFDASVATRKGVVFTDSNAAATKSKWAMGMDGLTLVDFDAVKRKSTFRGTTSHSSRQAEVLIPEQIRTENISYVAFRSQASLDEGCRLCSGLKDLPPFRVEPDYFHLGERGVFGCVNAVLLNRRPYQRNVTRQLNDQQLNRLLASSAVNGGSVKQEKGISLVQRVAAERFLQLTVKWYGPGRRVIMRGVEEPDKPFRTHNVYDLCTTLGAEQLKPGTWRVESELNLGDVFVRQFTIRFDVISNGQSIPPLARE